MHRGKGAFYPFRPPPRDAHVVWAAGGRGVLSQLSSGVPSTFGDAIAPPHYFRRRLRREVSDGANHTERLGTDEDASTRARAPPPPLASRAAPLGRRG